MLYWSRPVRGSNECADALVVHASGHDGDNFYKVPP